MIASTNGAATVTEENLRFSTYSAVGDLFQVAGSPFVGAALSAIGGLVGGSTIPRASR
jgi:hypothetical protein